MECFVLVFILSSLLWTESETCTHPNPTADVIGSGPGTCQEKQFIIDYHNILREKLASGGVAGWPQASDMVEITWNMDAEKLARSWVKRCLYAENRGARLPNGDWLGENVGLADGYQMHFENKSYTELLSRAMDGWFLGGSKSAVASPTTLIQGNFDHTAWSKTRQVGCAYIHLTEEQLGENHGDQRLYTFVLACYYLPKKDIMGGSYYSTGPVNCNIDGLRGSERYSSLCRALDTDVEYSVCDSLSFEISKVYVQKGFRSLEEEEEETEKVKSTTEMATTEIGQQLRGGWVYTLGMANSLNCLSFGWSISPFLSMTLCKYIL